MYIASAAEVPVSYKYNFKHMDLVAVVDKLKGTQKEINEMK